MNWSNYKPWRQAHIIWNWIVCRRAFGCLYGNAIAVLIRELRPCPRPSSQSLAGDAATYKTHKRIDVIHSRASFFIMSASLCGLCCFHTLWAVMTAYTFTGAFAAISPTAARVREFRYWREPEWGRSTGRETQGIRWHWAYWESHSGGNLGEECGTICRLMTDDVFHWIVHWERWIILNIPIASRVTLTSRLVLCLLVTLHIS